MIEASGFNHQFWYEEDRRDLSQKHLSILHPLYLRGGVALGKTGQVGASEQWFIDGLGDGDDDRRKLRTGADSCKRSRGKHSIRIFIESITCMQ